MLHTSGKRLSILFPNLFHLYLLPITAELIHPKIKPVELGQILHMPSNKAMKTCIRFIEHAYPDAVCAIPLIPHPELKALFRIDVPFINTVIVGKCGPLCGGFVEADGLSGT